MPSSEDDNIELIELNNSPSSTKSYTKAKPDIIHKKTPHSPTSSPSTHTEPKTEVKNPIAKPHLPPVPAKRSRRRVSKSVTEITSGSQDTLDGFKGKNLDEFTESNLSSKSDTKSYREKFRERFESVKKQAGKSVSKAHKSYTFKSRSEKIKHLKRGISLMRKENEQIETELKGYRESKTKSNETEEGDVNKFEAYNFFCDECQLASDQDDDENRIENLGNIERSAEVLIAIHDNDEDNQVQFVPAEKLNAKIKIAEDELLWKPSSAPLSISEKISNREPRFLEEEGFYVEALPSIPSSHLNILERRLLSDNDRQWFNCEGNLDFLQNPCCKTSYRPHLHLQDDSHLQTVYIPALIDEIPGTTLTSIHSNILEISIVALNFKHHPLFSAEHVFEQKLIKYYDEYKIKLNANKLERISKRLDALRSVKKNLLEKETSLEKLSNCMEEIAKLRKLYFEEGKENRTTLKSILKSWKTIKKIRETNSYANTSIKLNIRKEKCSYEREKVTWAKQIEETCQEIISEMELAHQAKIKTYKKELEQWRLQVQDDERNEESSITKKPRKPSRNIDEEIIVQEVTEKFKECFRSPGEPILNFILSHDSEVSDKTENNKEKLRRTTVATTKIYLRLLCNKIEVCKSKPMALNENFICCFHESFSIQVTDIPENICIEIHEQPNTLMKRKLGELLIKIPQRSVYTKNNKVLEQYFEKDELIHYKHEGVGSGIEVKDIVTNVNEDGSKEVLNTTGVLTFRIGWEAGHGNVQEFEENERLDVEEDILNEDGTIDVNKLNNWIKEHNPDPQDPKYSILYEYIKNYEFDSKAAMNATNKYFRLNPEMKPFEFCDFKEIEDNPRFKILELRNRNEPEFVGMVVPNRIKEIPPGILDDYNQRLQRESRTDLDDDNDDEDKEEDVDTKRSLGKKQLKQTYTKVFQCCRSVENNLSYDDVVDEKMIPYIQHLIKTIISNIINWIQFQPTINTLALPVPKQPSTKVDEVNGMAKIIISINSAVHVPIRKENSMSPHQDQTMTDLTTHFVEVTYQNINLQTASAEGSTPTWNSELILALDSTNTDYLSPNSLNGSVVIKLFDEIHYSERGTKITNWLGSIEIPVSTVCQTNKIEGLFKLQRPVHTLGYNHEYPNYTKRANIQQNESEDTFLSLKLVVQPNLPKLTYNMNELESTELPYLKQHILKWNEKFNNDYPQRKFFALTIDANGKTTCVTRYIKPLEPPQLNTDRFVVTATQCAHYISMIPFTDTNKFYQNVWLTTEQLLKFMVGSIIDHAIALTCYLTSLNLEVWLLLGYGLPQGSTAYVLVREHSRDSQTPSHFIYDVATAIKHNVTDASCPLKSVFCIINEHNIWANVQRAEQIQSTRFDFNRRSDWLPLFTPQNTAPTNSVQQKLIYSSAPDIEHLEFQLSKKIRKKIIKLRKPDATVWNHYLSRALKREMGKFESDRVNQRRNSQVLLDLRELESLKSVSGFILNMPYSNISSILNTIISTKIHLHKSMDIEFGLAVQIFSYPNHVLSVWICLGSVLGR